MQRGHGGWHVETWLSTFRFAGSIHEAYLPHVAILRHEYFLDFTLHGLLYTFFFSTIPINSIFYTFLRLWSRLQKRARFCQAVGTLSLASTVA
ncbi:hypothetical protein BDZ45DRAFT_248757 [Acephala macrosclerotiorum]|nr:hypothetical protein BDZ45DRAFT_248757 [Acephala macrosclerotiorum]